MNTFFARKSIKEAGLLLGICILFIVLRFPSFFEPYWYGDEGIYFVISKALHAGRTLYGDIWDNKPPLLYWMYYLLPDLFSIRFVSMLFGLGSVITFFCLSQKLLTKKYVPFIATLSFGIFLGLPTIEGNIANAENFMLFPILLGALLFWNATEKLTHENTLSQAELRRTRKLLFIAGISVGLAFLFKTVALFDFAAMLVFLVFVTANKTFHPIKLVRQLKKKYILFVFGFSLPLLLVSVLFLIQGTLPDFLSTIFLKNVSYVGENNVFFIPQGLLLIKALLLLIALGLLFAFHRYFDRTVLFVLVWLSFSLFNTFFSQRPYIHYQLVILPSLILLFGLILQVREVKQRLFVAGIAVSCFLILYTMFPHWNAKKTNAYYSNFILYLTGQRSIYDYQTFFDWNTPRDYALADYLSLHTKPNDELYIWGNSAQIYYLSDTLPVGKYTVSYHVMTPETITETVNALSKNPPMYFIILPGTELMPFTIPDYTYKLTIGDALVYEKTH